MKKNNKSQSDPEVEALALFAGRPSILETFLDLTEKGSIKIKFNPNTNIGEWKPPENASEYEIKRFTAIKMFWEKGYIISKNDEASSDFIITADDWAMEVRRAYDHLPQTLKDKIIEELSAG